MTELKNGTEYTFRVRAVNEIGSSELSAPAGPATPDTLPEAPAAPRVKFGDGALTVTWNQPATEGSPVAKYRIELRGTGAPGVVDETALTRTFTGLRNGESYSVRVRAVSSRDQEGPWSPIATEIPAGVPGAPINLRATRDDSSKIGNGVVNVRWDKAPDNGAPVKSYAVTAKPEGGGSTVTGTLTGETTALLEGVRNGVTYTVSVTATNKAGVGETASTSVRIYEAPSAARPVSAEGQAAQNVASRPFENGKVDYSWREPEHTGGAGIVLAHYEVEVRGNRATTTSPSLSVDGLSGGTTSPTVKVRPCTAPEANGGFVCSSEWLSIAGAPVVTAPAPGDVTVDRTVEPARYRLVATAPAGAKQMGGDTSGTSTARLYIDDVLTAERTVRPGEPETFASTSGGDGVEPGTVVRVVLTTVNSQGQSSAEATFTVASPSNPGGPVVTPGDSCDIDKACVTWSFDTKPFWKFEKYEVIYKVGSETYTSDPITDFDTKSHSLAVSGAAPSYQVQVVAYGKRWGSPSKVESRWVAGNITRPTPTEPPTTEPPTTEPTTPPEPGAGG